jgi:hypothetical protein
VFLRVVAEIPDVIHRAALLVQQAVQRFHPVAVDKNHVANSNVGMPPAGGAPFTPRSEEAVAKGYTAERDGFSRPDNSSTYKAELFRFVPFATASEGRGFSEQI